MTALDRLIAKAGLPWTDEAHAEPDHTSMLVRRRSDGEQIGVVNCSGLADYDNRAFELFAANALPELVKALRDIGATWVEDGAMYCCDCKLPLATCFAGCRGNTARVALAALDRRAEEMEET